MRTDEVRATGKTGGAEAAEAEAEEILQAMSNETEEERERTIVPLSFARMRLEWRPEDRVQMTHIRTVVDGMLIDEFPDTYALMHELFDIVRERVVNERTGEFKVDMYDLPVWKMSNTGRPIEDYAKLTMRDRENFLFRITTQLFLWSQKQADLWAESLFAKAQFTEKHAIEYGRGVSGTIEDRTAAANRRTAEERYFAIFTAYLSRKADVLIRSMERIEQRLKDTLPN